MLTFWMRRHLRTRVFALVWLAIVAVQTADAQTVDVFGRTLSGAPSAANAQEPMPTPMQQNSAETRVSLFEPVRRAMAASVEWQSRLNARLQDTLAEQRNGSSALAAWTLVLLSFGYGVLHALGPGHGKLAVSSYLVSHRARVGHAVVLSVWSACVQAISAICLVGSTAWLTREGLAGVLTRAATLSLVSYFSLLCVGLITLWSIITRRDCCGEGRIELVPKRGRGSHMDFQQGSYLGASMLANRRARRGTRAYARSGNIWIARQIMMTGLAVGMRPCVGAIFVLITALANGIFMVGVLSAFAMAAGVSLTVLAIGLASLSINRATSARSVARRQALETIRTRFALAGALFITLFAAWQVLALLSGWQSATLI
ncbi:high frequency lysogenization protein HflD [Trinickia sp. LjRoot230]|uniref:nickel/cobalt transporter n=1 Tax=Trinickia sp. LjRoot230 TaxID=3342288 RepID=UPI003ECC2CD7